MNRRRLAFPALAAAALAALAVVAAPASACQPENADACQRCAELNRRWQALTGEDLMHCPY